MWRTHVGASLARSLATAAATPIGIAHPGAATVGRLSDKHAVHKSANDRRTKRFFMLGGMMVVCGGVVFAALNALGDSMMFYLTPTQLIERDPPMPPGKKFRLGGMVVNGSLVQITAGQPGVTFVVTDFSNDVEVFFEGALPQLFKENSSAVCEGTMRPNGIFEATEVLAKHDENYMPKEIAEQVMNNKQAATTTAATAAVSSSSAVGA